MRLRLKKLRAAPQNPVVFYSKEVIIIDRDMRKIGVWLAVFLGLSVTAMASETVLRVPLSSKLQLLQLLRAGLDVPYVDTSGRFVHVVADSTQTALLKFWGFSPVEIVPNLRQQGISLLGAAMGGYHTYAEVKTFLDSVAAARPDLVSPVFSIGQSLEGRDIWGVKLSNNPGGSDGRPEVLYTALTHAREPAGMEVLLYTIRYLLSNYGSDSLVTSLLSTRALYFIPVVNPDGYVYNQTTNPAGGGLWRKNRRPNGDSTYGVDLNRNFGYKWGYGNDGSSPTTSSEIYRGTAPFSEPETQRLRDFVLSRNFKVEIDYHTYGDLWLFPWGYFAEPAPDFWLYRALADTAAKYNAYTAGPAWQLYLTNGTSNDWSYGADSTRRVLSFTPEVGGASDGFWPPLYRLPALEAENLQPNLFYARVADNPRIILPPEPPRFLAGDSLVANGQTQLSWMQSDPGNLAAGYRLKVSTGPQRITDSVRNADNWELVGFSRVPSPGDSTKYSFYSGANPASTVVMDTRNALLLGPHDTLAADGNYNIEQYFDYAYAEISTNGGKSYRTLAGNFSVRDGSPLNRDNNGLTGFSGGWGRMFFPLDAYSGQKVRLRFSYFTDLSNTPGGIYLCNISPVLHFVKDSVLALPADSSYLFTFLRAGDYYFSVATLDSQGQTGRYSDWIKKTVGFIPVYLDLNGDGQATPADLVLELNYVFLGIVPPVHPERADANGDGILSSADVVLYLNFIFLGQGP